MIGSLARPSQCFNKSLFSIYLVILSFASYHMLGSSPQSCLREEGFGLSRGSYFLRTKKARWTIK